MNQQQNQKGFTLIELLVVLGLIGILAAVLIAVIKPTEIFRKARDSQRLGDLRNLDQALSAYIVESSQTGNIILDNSNNTTCSSTQSSPSSTIYTSYNLAQTSITIGGFNYIKGSSSTAVDGTGWLPVNFSGVTILQLSKLPLDPRNTGHSGIPSLYYSYACKTDLTYELNANMESNTSAEANDGGNNPNLYEIGPNKDILPSGTSTLFYPNH